MRNAALFKLMLHYNNRAALGWFATQASVTTKSQLIKFTDLARIANTLSVEINVVLGSGGGAGSKAIVHLRLQS